MACRHQAQAALRPQTRPYQQDDACTNMQLRMVIGSIYVIMLAWRFPMACRDAYGVMLCEGHVCWTSNASTWGIMLNPFADAQMEYEDVLPYSEFSVRLPQHAIYRLPYVLQEIMDTPGKVRILLCMLWCRSHHSLPLSGTWHACAFC